MKYFIAYDLGTGGIKAGIYGEDGISRGFCFKAYDTYFPRPNFREQRPEDWWRALAATTKDLLSDTGINPNDIVSLAVSGHSLGALPIGKDGSLLANTYLSGTIPELQRRQRNFLTKPRKRSGIVLRETVFLRSFTAFSRFFGIRRICPRFMSRHKNL